nr:fibronectin type III domain-containing protein [Geobacter sp. AOG1]
MNFTAPASDGGMPILAYTVTSNPGGLSATGAASPITVTGLTNGTPYTFTVTATNVAGTSAPSAASNSVTPVATAPGAPTGVTATFGDRLAVVSFVAPPSGGSTITGYTVTSIPGGITATGTTSPITVTGLTNGTAYTFTVTATNAIGTSVVSAASGSVTPVTPRLMGGAVQGIPLSKAPVTVSTLAGSTWGSIDGTGTAASFGQVFGITTDGANLYVTEINGTVRKTVIATGVVTTLAGTFNLNGYADGTGPAAQFGRPAGITTDGTNLYMTDSKNLNVRKIVIATGEVTTLAGQTTDYPPPTPIDGIGTAARFGKPQGITTDGTNLYVADFGYSSIRKIVIATGEVTTLAGTAGTVGSADGIGAAVRFNGLEGITTDGTYLYVADTYNCTIRKVVIATGEVTTLAGAPLATGGTDGIGTAARFQEPMGIITDGAYLYIADQAAGNVRRMLLSTKAVTTLAGAPAGTLPGQTMGYADGTGTAVRFNHPRCITTDGKSLFIADGDNGRIRKMQ